MRAKPILLLAIAGIIGAFLTIGWALLLGVTAPPASQVAPTEPSQMAAAPAAVHIPPPSQPELPTGPPPVEEPAPLVQTERPRPNYSARPAEPEPGTDVLDWDMMKTNPGYMVLVDRHIAIKHLLASDAARSPEGKQIIALCRAFNYEPWTVSAAYTIAWEYSKKAPPDAPSDRPNFELLSAQGMESMIQYNLGFHFAPEFLDEVRKINPVMEFGRSYHIGVIGEPLLDETTWADLPDEIL